MAILLKQTTEAGIEMQIGTNHFGHFLHKSIAQYDQGIGAITNHQIYRDNFQLDGNAYAKWPAYAQIKLRNILSTRDLTKRSK